MRAILFDCDGVLVDSEPALAKVAAEVMNAVGIAAEPKDFIPYIGTGEDTYLGKVVEKYQGVYTSKIKDLVYQRYMAEGVRYLKSFPDCEKVLYHLAKKNIPMAVVSSADEIKVHANLSILDFDVNKFAAIISGSDVKRKKPWPDIYLLAARRLAANPEECIVVEDATAGIEAGNRAGMMTVGFTSNCTKEELVAAGADYVVDDYIEMQEVIERYLT